MEVYTIGFTQTTAERFFGRLKDAGVRRLLDVRLNNTSQLSGFARRDDLPFFLRELCGAEYQHEPLLAPTPDLLDAYRKKRIDWDTYAQRFLLLLAERRVDVVLDRSLFDVPTVILCSEAGAERCHRRLVAEYLGDAWGQIAPVHL
ncbi:MAG: DUF488 domain-containing protein [Chloroflexi bacterium]|nr:DUF488 domain-containing protein [Chloroflexota bacterium]